VPATGQLQGGARITVSGCWLTLLLSKLLLLAASIPPQYVCEHAVNVLLEADGTTVGVHLWGLCQQAQDDKPADKTRTTAIPGDSADLQSMGWLYAACLLLLLQHHSYSLLYSTLCLDKNSDLKGAAGADLCNCRATRRLWGRCPLPCQMC
jgi:hypothetical protein